MTLQFVKHFESNDLGDFTFLVAEPAQLTLYCVVSLVKNVLAFHPLHHHLFITQQCQSANLLEFKDFETIDINKIDDISLVFDKIYCYLLNPHSIRLKKERDKLLRIVLILLQNLSLHNEMLEGIIL